MSGIERPKNFNIRKITQNGVMMVAFGLGALTGLDSCAPKEINEPRTTFLAPTSPTENDRLKRSDLDKIIYSSINPAYMGNYKSIRSVTIDGGVQWKFSLEHTQFGQEAVDKTDMVVNVIYKEGKLSQYEIDVNGLDQVTRGDLKNYFKPESDDPTKPSEKSILKSTENTPGKTVESSVEKSVRPLDEITRDLLRAAGEFFALPFNMTVAPAEKPSGIDLVIVKGKGKNSFGEDVEITVNNLGAAVYKVTKLP